VLKLHADFGKKQELYAVKSRKKGAFWHLCTCRHKTKEHADTSPCSLKFLSDLSGGSRLLEYFFVQQGSWALL